MPYEAVECINKEGRTSNELMVWLEKMMRKYGNLQNKYWELFFEFSMGVTHMDPNDKNSSVLAMEVDPVTTANTKFWKWKDQRFDATF